MADPCLLKQSGDMQRSRLFIQVGYEQVKALAAKMEENWGMRMMPNVIDRSYAI